MQYEPVTVAAPEQAQLAIRKPLGITCERCVEELNLSSIFAEYEMGDGKGRRCDELPKELAHQESRLKKIREAKTAPEKEVRESVQQKASELQ